MAGFAPVSRRAAVLKWLASKETDPRVLAGQVATAPTDTPAASASRSTPGGGSRVPRTRYGSPIPGQPRHASTHETANLPGYPAYDYMAPAGSTAVAPATGTVIRLSGHDPSAGPTNGPHGPFGWSVYIKGKDGHTYYLTHLGSRTVRVGQRVRAGQKIGTVGNYAKYGGANHVHEGVH